MGLTEDQQRAARAELREILAWLSETTEVELSEAQLAYLNSLFLAAIEPAGNA